MQMSIPVSQYLTDFYRNGYWQWPRREETLGELRENLSIHPSIHTTSLELAQTHSSPSHEWYRQFVTATNAKPQGKRDISSYHQVSE